MLAILPNAWHGDPRAYVEVGVIPLADAGLLAAGASTARAARTPASSELPARGL
jgi:hypothetical protein